MPTIGFPWPFALLYSIKTVDSVDVTSCDSGPISRLMGKNSFPSTPITNSLHHMSHRMWRREQGLRGRCVKSDGTHFSKVKIKRSALTLDSSKQETHVFEWWKRYDCASEKANSGSLLCFLTNLDKFRFETCAVQGKLLCESELGVTSRWALGWTHSSPGINTQWNQVSVTRNRPKFPKRNLLGVNVLDQNSVPAHKEQTLPCSNDLGMLRVQASCNVCFSIL